MMPNAPDPLAPVELRGRPESQCRRLYAEYKRVHAECNALAALLLECEYEARSNVNPYYRERIQGWADEARRRLAAIREGPDGV